MDKDTTELFDYIACYYTDEIYNKIYTAVVSTLTKIEDPAAKFLKTYEVYHRSIETTEFDNSVKKLFMYCNSKNKNYNFNYTSFVVYVTKHISNPELKFGKEMAEDTVHHMIVHLLSTMKITIINKINTIVLKKERNIKHAMEIKTVMKACLNEYKKNRLTDHAKKSGSHVVPPSAIENEELRSANIVLSNKNEKLQKKIKILEGDIEELNDEIDRFEEREIKFKQLIDLLRRDPSKSTAVKEEPVQPVQPVQPQPIQYTQPQPVQPIQYAQPQPIRQIQSSRSSQSIPTEKYEPVEKIIQNIESQSDRQKWDLSHAAENVDNMFKDAVKSDDSSTAESATESETETESETDTEDEKKSTPPKNDEYSLKKSKFDNLFDD